MKVTDQNIGAGPLAADFKTALVAWLAKDGESGYIADRLHYGADLSPDACERATFYNINEARSKAHRRPGYRRDDDSLGTQLRFYGGRVFEDAVAYAFEAVGETVLRQVKARPLRPSAWCWNPGSADIVLAKRRHGVEVKAPRAAAFARATGMPAKLVRESHRWQASAYFYALRDQGVVDSWSLIYIDREGGNEPVEVPLVGDLLVPLDAIVAEETRKAYLITATTEPPRLARETVAKVWKGRPKTGRVVQATADLPWRCRYCSWRGTCRPGEESIAVDLGAAMRDAAIATAEQRWSAGSTTTPQVVRFDGHQGVGADDALGQRDDPPVDSSGVRPGSTPGGDEERSQGDVPSVPSDSPAPRRRFGKGVAT
jgi:hypothetical protein